MLESIGDSLSSGDLERGYYLKAAEAYAKAEEAKEAYIKAVDFFRKANYGPYLREAQRYPDRLTKPPGAPTPTPAPAPAAKPQEAQEPLPAFTLRTRLTSPSGGENAPKGKAKFDVDGLEQEIEVRVENVTPGAPLVVTLDDKEVGTTRADEDGKAELELKSRKPPSFPRVGSRPTVVVTDEAGNILVRGTFPPRAK